MQKLTPRCCFSIVAYGILAIGIFMSAHRANGQTSTHRRSTAHSLRSKSLFGRAQKLFRPDHAWDWGGADNDEYRWISDSEIFYADYYQLEPGSARIEMARLYRRNIKTGQKIELKRLETLVNCFYHSQIELSPNGKWLLWHGGNETDTIEAATLDGRHHRIWPSGYYTLHRLGWTRDSRHWIELRCPDSSHSASVAVTHTVYQPGNNPGSRLGHGPDLYNNFVVGKQIVSVNQPDGDKPMTQVTLTHYSLPPRIRWQGTLKSSVPRDLPNPNIEEAVLSPDARRLAMVVGYGAKLIEDSNDQFRQAGAEKYRTYALLVCQVNGRGMHMVGTWKEEMNPNLCSSLGDVRWLPSGKRLSFFYNNLLYTVPV